MLFTGVSKFSKVSIFSDLNNLSDITFHPQFNALGGITQQELETNFSEEIKSFSEHNPSVLNDVKLWYNGYTWNGKQTVYNPFSLLKFIESGQFENYWFSTGTPTFLVNFIRQAGKFTLDEEEYTSLSSLSQFDINHLEFKPMLFQTGYLTFSEVNFSEDSCKLKYPNKEVKASLEQYLLAAYTQCQRSV